MDILFGIVILGLLFQNVTVLELFFKSKRLFDNMKFIEVSTEIIGEGQ